MIIFTTFTSTGYEAARDRILNEVKASRKFDLSYSYNEQQLTPELLSSPTFLIKKGLGHYSWKPDIIWQTLKKANDGDVIVYLDAGCSVFPCKEWDKYFGYLGEYDILAFRLHQRNYLWTRNSVFEHFSSIIDSNWRENFQMGANVLIVKKSAVGMSFVSEWRDYMINRLDLCGDVPKDEMPKEDSRLIENRYDQTILTALVYKYLQLGCVKTVWEHFEGEDSFRQQAFIAARKRNSQSVDRTGSWPNKMRCLIKQYLFYPFAGNFIWYKCLKQSNK